MQYLRTRAKKLSLLAFFALALQFGFSFGHIHKDFVRAASGFPAAQSLTSPTSGGSSDQAADNDLCSICATMAMANTIVDAVPPALPLPSVLGPERLSFATSSTTRNSRWSYFQSRAPPQS